MKRLIMCEGPNELMIMRILLDYHCLVFGENELIGLTPYHARQIKGNAQVRTELNLYPGRDVLIMRIGDKLGEKLSIPGEYKDKIVGVEKYCTKPELEILLILSEELLSEFEKVKSTVSPKSFAKQNIKLGRKRYDNSTKFFEEYYGKCPERLVGAIQAYKRTHGAHKKDELYLADLLV